MPRSQSSLLSMGSPRFQRSSPFERVRAKIGRSLSLFPPAGQLSPQPCPQLVLQHLSPIGTVRIEYRCCSTPSSSPVAPPTVEQRLAGPLPTFWWTSPQ